MPTPILPPPSDWPSLAPHPGTITWRRAGDARVLIAAGYALLLQVAHPTVGAGVSEHSQFQRDPWGRLLRTLDYTYTMGFGGPRAAGEMGRRIRAFHTQIKGTTPDGRRYHALEPGAYAWVHATLAEAIVLAHERFGRRFTSAQREQFWGEWRALGSLLGIRARDLPAGWGAFQAYVEEIVEQQLLRTSAVEEVLSALARPAPPPLPAPLRAARLRAPLRAAWNLAPRPQAGHLMTLATVGLAAPTLRRRLGLRWTRANELELGVLAGALRAATPLMPAALRNTGPGYLRWRSEALARGDVACAAALGRC
jgi:uncharacterized protein (DUF2236 family)